MDQLHFLMLPLMSHSHIIPLTNFSKLLAQRGVAITIVATPLNVITYKDTIDSFRAQNLKIQMIPIEFPCQEAGLPVGCENLDTLNSLELIREFFQAFEMLQGPLENLIQELEPKPDCLISTSSISWTQRVADRFNIPRYVFETVSCFTLLCSNKISESRVKESIVSAAEPFLVPGIPHVIEFTKAQLPRALVKNSKDLVKNQAWKSPQGTILNSFQELEPWYLEAYKQERGNVWCIGPVSLTKPDNKASINDHYCITWLDSMKPKSVIYACFGSLCRISIPQMKEIGLGLEASNIPFIWVVRKQDECYSSEVEKWLVEEGFQERVRGRGLVVRGWAPQVAILSHPSVGGFLTHCGWNSTLEGVCAGVPMITWPMFAEQFYNEKFIVSVLGIGVGVGVESCMNIGEDNEGNLVKWDRVKNGVEKVMGESEDGMKRRKRAEKVAEMAKNAVEEGGSSYLNLTVFIQDVIKAKSVLNF